MPRQSRSKSQAAKSNTPTKKSGKKGTKTTREASSDKSVMTSSEDERDPLPFDASNDSMEVDSGSGLVHAQSHLERLEAMYSKFWKGKKVYSESVIADIYEIIMSGLQESEFVWLESSAYMDKYLLHFLKENVHWKHVISLLTYMNFKLRGSGSGLNASECIEVDKLVRALEIAKTLRMSDIDDYKAKMALIKFWKTMFNNLHIEEVRAVCLPLMKIPIWSHLSSARLQKEFERSPAAQKSWKKYEKRFSSISEVEKNWLYDLLTDLKHSLSADDLGNSNALGLYVATFVDLLTDLLSQIVTRIYVCPLIDDLFIVDHLFNFVKSGRSNYEENIYCLDDLVSILHQFQTFPIDVDSISMLDDNMRLKFHYESFNQLQKLIFSDSSLFSKLKEFCMLNVSSLDQKSVMRVYLNTLSLDEAVRLCKLVGLELSITEQDMGISFVIGLLVDRFCAQSSIVEEVTLSSVFPSAQVMWNKFFLGTESWDGQYPLPYPKLGLQYLCLEDYLCRYFQLLQLESNYDVRKDVEDSILRLAPRVSSVKEKNYTEFAGWSRMAVGIEKFEVISSRKQMIGRSEPSIIVADLYYAVGKYNENIRQEWDCLRTGDVVFLASLTAQINSRNHAWTEMSNGKNASGKTFAEHFGVNSVRGAEVVGFVSADGRVVTDELGKPYIEGERTANHSSYERVIRVQLDADQYQDDIKIVANASELSDESGSLMYNVLVRRKPSVNNSKYVLDSIKEMLRMNPIDYIPSWLADIFVGYGNPKDVHYSQMIEYFEGQEDHFDEDGKKLNVIRFHKTFVDLDHIKSTIGAKNVVIKDISTEDKSVLSCYAHRLQIPDLVANYLKIAVVEAEFEAVDSVSISFALPPLMSPFPENSINVQNCKRYTQAQVEAIKSGCLPGLSVIVGPPGTGKTDVVVQIIKNCYLSSNAGKTVLITKSNHALNQVFEMLVNLGISEKHLLRLGHGEEDLELSDTSSPGYGKHGRIQWFKSRRSTLLQLVSSFAASLDKYYGDVGSTCQSAFAFFESHVTHMWTMFLNNYLLAGADRDVLLKNFPFKKFFISKFDNNEDEFLRSDAGTEECNLIFNSCWRYLKDLFEELRGIRPFEVLNSNFDRANYLLTNESRIIAMTSTFAAMKRSEFLKLGLKFENLIIEEAGQIMEIESLISVGLQSHKESTMLKRFVLVGDHNQLPPIVKNLGLKGYSNLDSTLISRLIKLGVRTVQLDAQGRMRESLKSIFSWKYSFEIHDLPIIAQEKRFSLANPGFLYTYQLINMDEYMGDGETSPNPQTTQNLGEAEYVVALYQYMRLLGYPADKITILTPYNGQRSLIMDVLKLRCAWNPMFGQPLVSTVDKYQGRQNEYVLLSLVRTKTIGYMKDLRRLVVTLSRSRLGFYVICNYKLFSSIPEMKEVFDRLCRTKKNELCLVENERYEDFNSDDNFRLEAATPSKYKQINGPEELGQLVYVMCQKVVKESAETKAVSM